MNIVEYTNGQTNSTKITENFKVSEFSCNDGSGYMKLDLDGVEQLQQVRDVIGGAINITSAYRNETYNAKVGGASSSKHITGQAFDCQFSAVGLPLFCKTAQVAGFKGIILYDKLNFVHVDTRDSQYFAYNDTSKTVTTWLTQISSGSSGQDVTDLQTMLNKVDGAGLDVDGKFGSATKAAVMAFQTANNLVIDGICGKLTWTALLQ